MKRTDVIGLKFGKLTTLSRDSTTRNGHIRYLCQCDCGSTCKVLITHLRQGNTKSCGCDRPIGKTHHQWSGMEEISGDFWHKHIIRSANGEKQGNRVRRPKELSVTLEYCWNLFLKQNRRCALTGIELIFPIKNKDLNYTASLDRIDSTKGYIEGNVQWVHKHINIMKNKFNNEYFINMCKLVSLNNGGGKCEV